MNKRPYADPRFLGYLAIFFLSLATLVDVLWLCHMVSLYPLITTSIDESAGQSVEWQSDLLSWCSLVGIVSLFPSLAWIRRITINAHALDGYISISPGKALLCFGVPFINLVMPIWVLTQIWRASNRNPQALPTFAMVLWFISTDTFIGLWLFAPDADPQASQETVLPLLNHYVVLFAFFIVSQVSAVAIILQICRCQQKMHALLLTEQAVHVPEEKPG